MAGNYMTQILSEGYFRRYLLKMRKADDLILWTARKVTEHAIFAYGKWNADRRDLQLVIGHFYPVSLVESLIHWVDIWNPVAHFLEAILNASKGRY